jgi:hypothetical protein
MHKERRLRLGAQCHAILLGRIPGGAVGSAGCASGHQTRDLPDRQFEIIWCTRGKAATADHVIGSIRVPAGFLGVRLGNASAAVATGIISPPTATASNLSRSFNGGAAGRDPSSACGRRSHQLAELRRLPTSSSPCPIRPSRSRARKTRPSSFLVVAVIVGIRRGQYAGRGHAQTAGTANLYDFSRKIAGAASLDDVLWAAVHHAASTPVLLLVLLRAARPSGSHPIPAEDQCRRLGAAHWAAA